MNQCVRRPGRDHLAQRGVAAPSRAEPVGVVGEPDVVVGLQQQAHDLGDQLVRPGRQAQRALLPVLLGDVDPLDRPPSIPLTAQQVDDRLDLGQGHPVHGLPGDPGRHRTGVGVDATVGPQEQLRIEQLPIQPLQRQAAPAAFPDDAQNCLERPAFRRPPGLDITISLCPFALRSGFPGLPGRS